MVFAQIIKVCKSDASRPISIINVYRNRQLEQGDRRRFGWAMEEVCCDIVGAFFKNTTNFEIKKKVYNDNRNRETIE